MQSLLSVVKRAGAIGVSSQQRTFRRSLMIVAYFGA